MTAGDSSLYPLLALPLPSYHTERVLLPPPAARRSSIGNGLERHGTGLYYANGGGGSHPATLAAAAAGTEDDSDVAPRSLTLANGGGSGSMPPLPPQQQQQQLPLRRNAANECSEWEVGALVNTPGTGGAQMYVGPSERANQAAASFLRQQGFSFAPAAHPVSPGTAQAAAMASWVSLLLCSAWA